MLSAAQKRLFAQQAAHACAAYAAANHTSPTGCHSVRPLQAMLLLSSWPSKHGMFVRVLSEKTLHEHLCAGNPLEATLLLNLQHPNILNIFKLANVMQHKVGKETDLDWTQPQGSSSQAHQPCMPGRP